MYIYICTYIYKYIYIYGKINRLGRHLQNKSGGVFLTSADPNIEKKMGGTLKTIPTSNLFCFCF